MKIAYVTSCFGSLSHTFIRREIRALRNLGLDIFLCGIRSDISPTLSESERLLIGNTRYLYPLKILRIIFANFYFLFRSPRTYAGALTAALSNEEKNFKKYLKMIYHFFVSSFMAKQMLEDRVEHIHAHFLNVSSSVAMYCAQILGITYSVTVHSAGTVSLDHMIGLKSKLKYAKVIIAISYYNVDDINKIYPCQEKTHVIRCGIDPEEYLYKPTRLSENNPLRLLAVGRFVEKKGFRYLIEAAEILKKKKFSFFLTIIGDGVLKPELDQLVKKLDLADFVCLPGAMSQEKIQKSILKNDVFIVPSVETSKGEKEGIPVVIMESLALGYPVVATRHSGIPEIIRHRISGLLVSEKDSEAIANAVFDFQKNHQLRDECVLNGRRIIEQEFNIKIEAQKLKNIFESINAG